MPFFKKLRSLRSDRADSQLISAIFLLPFIAGMLFTTIDSAIYFNNRTNMQAFARDAARSVAIMGGKGTSTTATPIEKQYGNDTAACSDPLLQRSIVKKAYKNTLTPIECNLISNIAKSNIFVGIEAVNVSCNPPLATYITQRTSCEIKWSYSSIPASGLLLIRKPSSNKTPNFSDKPGLAGETTTIGTSESEVDLSDIGLEPR